MNDYTPGPELDKLIALEFIGYRDNSEFSPSILIVDAWKIINKLISMEVYPRIEFCNHRKLWICQCKDDRGELTDWFQVEGKTAPFTICLAGMEAIRRTK